MCVVPPSIVAHSHVSHYRYNEHQRQMHNIRAKQYLTTHVSAHTCSMVWSRSAPYPCDTSSGHRQHLTSPYGMPNVNH